MSQSEPLNASFRDPAGFLFRRDGELYRQVNQGYESHYDLLMSSGLYRRLVDEQLLIPHREADADLACSATAARVIRPEPVAYISYPWEWCFSQLQDAALTTLKIQQIARQYGMSLKDASAFNIQFHNGRPTLIDTLSLEPHREGQPWVAYRQFCQHFLAPLVLASYVDCRSLKLMQAYIDGIPLSLASRLLPLRTWLKYPLLAHIHLHAKAQQRYADGPKQRVVKVSALGMQALLDGLAGLASRLRWQPAGSQWGDYYTATNYAGSALADKTRLVESFLDRCPGAGLLLDLGANTGRFSRLGLERGFDVVAMDVDELSVERCYRAARAAPGQSLLPLVQDLSSPSPACGWALQERMSLLERGEAQVVMALALLHHLVLSNNVPLESCARLFARLGRNLIIEFVPRNDSQAQRLLATREDVFPGYHAEGFEAVFANYFEIVESAAIRDSERRLYLMRTIV